MSEDHAREVREIREGTVLLLDACLHECTDPAFERGGLKFMVAILREINDARARDLVEELRERGRI